MDIGNFAKDYLIRLRTVIDRFDFQAYERIVDAVLTAYNDNAHIFVMGNGGSGATASHLACDINKGCCHDLSKKFRMLCLNDNIPTLLALANDISYEAVFEEQLKNFFMPGDLVIGISGSGNSENVLRAIKFAADHDGRTMGWTGFGGGKLAEMAELVFVAQSHDMQQVEDAHVILVHMLMQTVFRKLHAKTASCVC